MDGIRIQFIKGRLEITDKNGNKDGHLLGRER